MNMMRLIGAGALALSLSAAAEDLTIAAGESVLLDADKEVGTLTVGEGATLWLNGHTLTVTTALAGTGRVCASTTVPDVPAGYTLLGCVKATGTQYIDTGIKPINEVRIEADVAYTGPTGDSVWQPLIGASNSENNNIYGVWIWPKSGSKWHVAYNGIDYTTGVAVNNSRCLINAGWKYTSSGKATVDFMIDGVSKLNQTVDKALATVNQTMMLPARNRNGAVAEISKCDIYSFKIYNPQTTLVRNYVPMKRNSDEAAGLFDVVSGEFFPSTTATPFEAGDEIGAPGGELHIIAVSGHPVENSTVSIEGGVKVVKEGNGTYTSKKSQKYTGGTVIKDGYVLSTVWYGFGPRGTSVDIQSGGQVCISKNRGTLAGYDVSIAGNGPNDHGAIYGSGTVSGSNTYIEEFLKSLTLTGDAWVESNGADSFNICGGQANDVDVRLNGYTLTVTGNNRTVQRNLKIVDSGKIVDNVARSGTNSGISYYVTGATGLSAPLVDFVVPSGKCIGGESTYVVSNLTFAGAWLPHANLAANRLVTVLGRYKPQPAMTTYLPRMTLGDAEHLTPVFDVSELSSSYAGGDTLAFADGANVTVDVGDRSVAVGDCLATWTLEPGETVGFSLAGNGWTGEDRELALVVRNDGLYVKTTAEPYSATFDIENDEWKFYLEDGSAYPGEWTDGITENIEVRFSSYDEYVAIKAKAVTPKAFVLTGFTMPEGTGLLDMGEGLDFTVGSGVEIDVKGRSISLPSSLVSGTKPFTVTSSVAGGEIIVDVAAGTTLRNTSMSLAGAVALRKTGAGTFVSAKAQTYEGGTFVDAGTAQPPDAALSGSDTTYSHDSFKAFGTGGIHVASGARFNLRGNYAYRTNIHLDGGTLLNDRVNMTSTTSGGSGVGSLSADSSVFVTNSIVFGDAGSANAGDLGGHVLEIHLPNLNNDANCYLRQNLTNGTIRTVLGGGRFLVVNDNLDLAGTTLDLGTPVNIKSGKAVNVQNYTATYNEIYMQGGGRINVYGTFTPAGSKGRFYTCTLQDGATLDLSGRTEAFNTRCSLHNASDWLAAATMSFAAPAEGKESIVVKVKVGTLERAKAIAFSEDEDGRYIVKWGAGEPQNVTFEFADDEPAASHGFKLESDDTGLKVVPKRGFVILIAEKEGTVPGAWVAKNYADFGDVEESTIETWLGGTGRTACRAGRAGF